jgi:hypothetical protein
MKHPRTGSAPGIKRPFQPHPGAENDAEHIADALDSIARSLSTIDHNLEVLTEAVHNLAQALPALQKR